MPASSTGPSAESKRPTNPAFASRDVALTESAYRCDRPKGGHRTMAGFVPGRDHATLEALSPEQIRQRNATESADQRAALDKEDLANLERAQTGVMAPQRKRTLLDRL